MIDISKVAAVKLTQKLEPVSQNEPIKPPTFAGQDGEPQYVMYQTKDGRRDVVLDNAPSQANRVEPMFAGTGLIPELTFEVDGKTVSITELGHRSCDAAARFSTGAQHINNALLAYQNGNAEPLA